MEKLCEPLGQQILCSSRSLRLRDAVTDAWSRSDIFSCAASISPRRFLGCDSFRPPLCNARKRGSSLTSLGSVHSEHLARKRDRLGVAWIYRGLPDAWMVE